MLGKTVYSVMVETKYWGPSISFVVANAKICSVVYTNEVQNSNQRVKLSKVAGLIDR